MQTMPARFFSHESAIWNQNQVIWSSIEWKKKNAEITPKRHMKNVPTKRAIIRCGWVDTRMCQCHPSYSISSYTVFVYEVSSVHLHFISTQQNMMSARLCTSDGARSVCVISHLFTICSALLLLLLLPLTGGDVCLEWMGRRVHNPYFSHRLSLWSDRWKCGVSPSALVDRCLIPIAHAIKTRAAPAFSPISAASCPLNEPKIQSIFVHAGGTAYAPIRLVRSGRRRPQPAVQRNEKNRTNEKKKHQSRLF